MNHLLRFFRMGYDTYERHRMIGFLIKGHSFSNVLDVGGLPGLLETVIHQPITVTNLNQGNIISSGLHLPFVNKSFDLVTSLDVLEHLSKNDREQFVDELIRVAKNQVIICTPYGSKEHISNEEKLLKQITDQGMSNEMLEEHVKYEIPSEIELKTYTKDVILSKKIYSGDFRYNVFLFKVDQFLIGLNAPKIFRFLITSVINILGNILIYPLNRSFYPQRFTNRITIVLTKSSIDS